MQPDDQPSRPRPWWGTFELETETGGRWNVGPSTLWLYRTEREWRVLYRPSDDSATTDPMADRSDATVPVSEEEMTDVLETEDDRIEINRYSFEKTEGRVALEPALADRAVVARPEDSLHMPSGETVTLYLSTPLWMRVVLPDSDRLVQEVPSHRMSDTWFGTSTTAGELCYATRTAGRMRAENLPQRIHRALTPLEIKNSASDALSLERVQLPMRHLALYKTANDVLCTPSIRMTRKEGQMGADIDIRNRAPAEAKDAELVREPRDSGSRGLFTSTFGAFEALFGT